MLRDNEAMAQNFQIKKIVIKFALQCDVSISLMSVIMSVCVEILQYDSTTKLLVILLLLVQET